MEVKKKRGRKGEGTVYQRSYDGLWIAEYKPPNHTKKKKFSANSEREVRKKLREYKASAAANLPENVKKDSVESYMKKWLTTTKKYKLKPKSYDRLEVTLTNQVFPHIGDIQIGSINANDIQSMLNKLADKGLSYSTLKKTYEAVNACFKLGFIRSEIYKNPCLGVEIPNITKKQASTVHFFTDDEINKIVAASTETYKTGKLIYRLGHAVILLLYTGMRIGEALALTWDDINFDNKTATISKSVVRIVNREVGAKTKYTSIVQDSVKTKAGNRIIYLNNKAINALNSIKEINGCHKYVLATENGEINGNNTIYQMFIKIQLKCGIEPRKLHALRHTFASILFKKGANVKAVSELLGHSDVNITYNTYIHLIKEQKQEAIALLDEL